MFDKVKDVIGKGKDATLSLVIETVVKSIFSKYGEVKNFIIDTTSK